MYVKLTYKPSLRKRDLVAANRCGDCTWGVSSDPDALVSGMKINVNFIDDEGVVETHLVRII